MLFSLCSLTISGKKINLTCGYSTTVSAPACHAGDGSSILLTRSKICVFMKKTVCENCGKILENRQSKFCSIECQTEYRYKKDVERWKAGELKGCDKSGAMSPFVRKYMLETHDYKCEKCGFSGFNTFTKLSILQIHHVDGDCMNNKEDNLQVLCPNCHALTDNFGRRNKKSSRVNRYKKATDKA